MSNPSYVPAGLLVVEDLLVRALDAGFRNIVSDLTVLDEMFPTIDNTEREQIKDFFRAMKKMTVLHGFARMDAKMPQWVVTLAGERTASRFVGDEEREINLGPSLSDQIVDEVGELDTHEIRITTYATNTMHVIFLYAISKVIMMQNWEAFHDLGMHEVELSGADLGPRAEFSPDFVYARTLTFSYKSFSILNMRCRKIVDITAIPTFCNAKFTIPVQVP